MKKLPAALLALALALALAGCGGEGASEIVQVPLDSLGEVRAMGEKCLKQLSEQEDGLPMSAEIREFDTFPEAVDCAGCKKQDAGQNPGGPSRDAPGYFYIILPGKHR